MIVKHKVAVHCMCWLYCRQKVTHCISFDA